MEIDWLSICISLEIEYYLNLDALDISLSLPLGYSIMMPDLEETALYQA